MSTHVNVAHFKNKLTDSLAMVEKGAGVIVRRSGGLAVPSTRLWFAGCLVFACLLKCPAWASGTAFVATQRVWPTTLTTVVLNGMATPNGSPTEVWFEYGTNTTYGTHSVSAAVGDGFAPVRVSALAAVLEPGVVYHCRLVASCWARSFSVGLRRVIDNRRPANNLRTPRASSSRRSPAPRPRHRTEPTPVPADR